MAEADDLREDIAKAIEEVRLASADIAGSEQVLNLNFPTLDKGIPAYSAPRVRASLTRNIVLVFLAYVLFAGLFIIFGGYAATASKIDALIEIAKTLLLPVVTLVIGHYFGSKPD